MLSLLVKLLQALNSENSSRQMALAASFGFIVGMTPFLSLHNLFILFFVLLLRVHIGSFILSVIFFSGVGYLLQNASIALGEYLLTLESLQACLTALYQSTWFKLAHFHHTYTFGAFMLSSVLAIPLYFTLEYLITKYRIHLKSFIENLYIVKALKTSKYYRWYMQATGQENL